MSIFEENERFSLPQKHSRNITNSYHILENFIKIFEIREIMQIFVMLSSIFSARSLKNITQYFS